MDFLPANYEAPKVNNNYLKLQDGENRIRILSRPIIGWEDWHERKPVRYRLDEKPSKSFDPKKPLKHFWSFVVYNVMEDKIQIMHVTQSTIRRSLEALCKDADWGAPYAYDIKIVRSGEGMDVEYHVNPVPHKPVSDHVIELFNTNKCNLEALFTGDDPFSADWSTYTPLGTSAQVEVKAEKASKSSANKEMIDDFWSQVSKKYKTKIIDDYIVGWCEHYKESIEVAIYSFMSDMKLFESKLIEWIEKNKKS